MSLEETSPLLPVTARSQDASAVHEHPIFLRSTHSPWSFVGQKILFAVRCLFLVYLAVTWALALWLDVTTEDTTALFPFRAENIILTVQIIFYWITAIWTIQHLMSPQDRPQRGPKSFLSRAGGQAMSIVSIPRTSEWNPTKKFAFSALYTMSVTLPIVITYLHWLVLGDRHGGHFRGDAKHDFIDVSTHGVNAIISVLEIFLLSSVKQLKPFVALCLTFAFLPVLYFAWAQIGHLIVQAYPYDEVDPDKNTAKQIVANVGTSMAISAAAFLVVQGLHVGRDIAVQKVNRGDST